MSGIRFPTHSSITTLPVTPISSSSGACATRTCLLPHHTSLRHIPQLVSFPGILPLYTTSHKGYRYLDPRHNKSSYLVMLFLDKTCFHFQVVSSFTSSLDFLFTGQAVRVLPCTAAAAPSPAEALSPTARANRTPNVRVIGVSSFSTLYRQLHPQFTKG